MFALLFIYTRATKLSGIQQTADLIATQISIPEAFAPHTAPLESATGMPTPQLLAVAVDWLELIAGLMIALNFGARFFVFVLVSMSGSRPAISTTFGISRRTATPAAGRSLEEPSDHRRAVHSQACPREEECRGGLRGRVGRAALGFARQADGERGSAGHRAQLGRCRAQINLRSSPLLHSVAASAPDLCPSRAIVAGRPHTRVHERARSAH
ncbi:DoxX family protein [Bradyrhizobium paxllaeri]|uniref:DoxX family protein n=1 Tax=Bradyrhizobium paxllaeri TaxID=190148 RepID=UPI001FEC55DA|nr:DoxX family protein [Bradyrhizobium paxllaeri]